MGSSRLHGNRRGALCSERPRPSYGGQACQGPFVHSVCDWTCHDPEPRRRWAALRHACLLLAILCGTLGSLSGCQESRQGALSKLNDVSYANHRGHTCGPNALEVPVALEDFEGSFVWVDYAAPWCAPCRRQAPVIRAVESSTSAQVVFLTLITSGNEPMEEATTATAAVWAERYNLDPSRVVASHEMSRTIPQHTLFSPQGQTLYHAIGYHSEAQIRAAIARHVNEWRRLEPEVSAVN